MTLTSLHHVIQIAMGWLDYHLWKYRLDDEIFGVPDPEDNIRGVTVHPADKTSLVSLTGRGMRGFSYTYDFGDDWLHHILVEGTDAAKPGIKYPLFLGGERRCPPEDCGGPPGYFEFIEAISGAARGRPTKAAKQALEWYGGPYDPNDIGEETIKRQLAAIGTPKQKTRPIRKGRD